MPFRTADSSALRLLPRAGDVDAFREGWVDIAGVSLKRSDGAADRVRGEDATRGMIDNGQLLACMVSAKSRMRMRGSSSTNLELPQNPLSTREVAGITYFEWSSEFLRIFKLAKGALQEKKKRTHHHCLIQKSFKRTSPLLLVPPSSGSAQARGSVGVMIQ